MDQNYAPAFILLAILFADLCARFALQRQLGGHASKPAGLIALTALCLSEGAREYAGIRKVQRMFFLALFMVLLLGLTTNFLLIRQETPQALLDFALMLGPILVLPFAHFLYGLINLEPRSLSSLLSEFRLRNALGLILSANIIFVLLEKKHHPLFLGLYFLLSFFSILGLLILSAQMRTPVSPYQRPQRSAELALLPMTMHYLMSLLELVYVLILMTKIFVALFLSYSFNLPMDPLIFSASILSLLFLATVIVKLGFLFGASALLEIYEERILPLSFLLFGIITVIRNYL